MNKFCFICGKDISFHSDSYLVTQAFKPKGYPKRWKPISYSCIECGDKYKIRFEYKDEVRNDILK